MKHFFASMLGTLAGLVLAMVGVVVLAFVFVAAVATLNKKTVVVEAGSYLVFDLNANLTDTPASADDSGLGALLAGGDGPQTLQLRQVARALREAAHDRRIAGVLLTGSLQPSDYGT